jgi:hypothetical protein
MSLAWGGHKNGAIPGSSMVAIGVSAYGLGQQYAQRDAARTFAEMNEALFKATGRRLAVGEGYRALARQRRLRNEFIAGRGNVAAVPGTSNHGWGRAIDFASYSSAMLRWLERNASKHGWSWATGKASQEPWHWEYVGAITPEPSNEEEEDMRLVRRNEGTPEWSLFGLALSGPSSRERGYYVITDPDEATDWARLLYRGSGSEQSEKRAVYIRLQDSARTAHSNYLRAISTPAAPSDVSPAGPTASDIAAEVIRQQKLPGN